MMGTRRFFTLSCLPLRVLQLSIIKSLQKMNKRNHPDSQAPFKRSHQDRRPSGLLCTPRQRPERRPGLPRCLPVTDPNETGGGPSATWNDDSIPDSISDLPKSTISKTEPCPAPGACFPYGISPSAAAKSRGDRPTPRPHSRAES